MSVLDTLTGLGVPLVVAPPKTGMIFQFSAAAGRLSLRIGTEAADAAPAVTAVVRPTRLTKETVPVRAVGRAG